MRKSFVRLWKNGHGLEAIQVVMIVALAAFILFGIRTIWDTVMRPQFDTAISSVLEKDLAGGTGAPGGAGGGPPPNPPGRQGGTTGEGGPGDDDGSKGESSRGPGRRQSGQSWWDSLFGVNEAWAEEPPEEPAKPPARRTFFLDNPGQFKGETIGNGDCVRFVQIKAGAPHTTTWVAGIRVKGNDDKIKKGTAIATMVDGKYPTDTDGKHAMFYDGQDEKGIWVWEQFLTPKQPVQRRHIPFVGSGYRSNDADTFYVIEAEVEPPPPPKKKPAKKGR